MAERSRFAARATNAAPMIGIGILAAVTIPLLGGGVWFVIGPLFGLIIIIAQLRRPRGTVLVVDKQGVHDRRLGIPLIPWRYVQGIERVNVGGTHYVNINLNRLGSESVELPPWRRLMTPMLSLLGIKHVHVVAGGLDATQDEVYASIFAAYAIASQPTEKLVIKPKG